MSKGKGRAVWNESSSDSSSDERTPTQADFDVDNLSPVRSEFLERISSHDADREFDRWQNLQDEYSQMLLGGPRPATTATGQDSSTTVDPAATVVDPRMISFSRAKQPVEVREGSLQSAMDVDQQGEVAESSAAGLRARVTSDKRSQREESPGEVIQLAESPVKKRHTAPVLSKTPLQRQSSQSQTQLAGPSRISDHKMADSTNSQPKAKSTDGRTTRVSVSVESRAAPTTRQHENVVCGLPASRSVESSEGEGTSASPEPVSVVLRRLPNRERFRGKAGLEATYTPAVMVTEGPENKRGLRIRYAPFGTDYPIMNFHFFMSRNEIENRTYFLPEQRRWGPTKEDNGPRALSQDRPSSTWYTTRRQVTTHWHSTQSYEIWLDNDGNALVDEELRPMRWSFHLPSAFSTEVQGWYLQSLWRQMPNFTLQDVIDRMPLGNGTTIKQPTVADLRERMEADEKKYGYTKWVLPP